MPAVARASLATVVATLAFSVVSLAPIAGCKAKRPPEPASAGAAAVSGTWEAWLELGPLLEIARTHAPPATVKAIGDAAKLLRKRQARSAYERLGELAASEGRHWITVARADVAALYFTVCIRGVAWRLVDVDKDTPLERRADFSEELKVGPGDLMIEALLTDLDAANASKIPARATQAQIARARVAAYVVRCAPNEDVARMSEEVLKSDLATLAAEGDLTPDLSYMWAGIQYSEYSGSAAKPFLLQAREAGYEDPALVYMLAVIALEQLELTQAEAYADEAQRAYKELDDVQQQAQVLVVRGEIARARKQPVAARKHFRAAQALVPAHVPAILGEAKLLLADGAELDAISLIRDKLALLVPAGADLEVRMRVAADNLEALVVMASEPELVTACRAALLDAVEDDPDVLRRGLRYFYAATLDAKLGEYQHARGHAILARDEFTEGEELAALVGQVDAFLSQIATG
jgi:hypothetical protein